MNDTYQQIMEEFDKKFKYKQIFRMFSYFYEIKQFLMEQIFLAEERGADTNKVKSNKGGKPKKRI